MNINIINKEYIFNVEVDNNNQQIISIINKTNNITRIIEVKYAIIKGQNGLNNYELAQANGFVGTYEEWELTQHGADGKDFTYEDFTPEQLEALKGDDGKDAYQSYLDTTTDVPPLSESEWSASFKLVDEFESLPEATTFETDDKLMINRLVGGVPTLYRIDKDLLFRESLLFSVRKIGDGSNNRAFRLRRSSDNNEQDIYFDINGNISDDSLTENGQTFGIWRNASTLYVIIWYNQSANGTECDLVSSASNIATFETNSKEIMFNNSKMLLRSSITYLKGYTSFNVQRFFRRTNTGGMAFGLVELWNFSLSIYNNKSAYVYGFFSHGFYQSGVNQYISVNSPETVKYLLSERVNIGGVQDDNLQTIFPKLNGVNGSVNINRDEHNRGVLYGYAGGVVNTFQHYRSEIRMYNYKMTDAEQISVENEIKTFFTL
jgi:hypothetical protein